MPSIVSNDGMSVEFTETAITVALKDTGEVRTKDGMVRVTSEGDLYSVYLGGMLKGQYFTPKNAAREFMRRILSLAS